MSTNEPVNAEAPFNDRKADMILRSSDNVDFRTFKVLLSLASPVFEDMFDLPQPGPDMNGEGMKDGLPVVSISERSKVIEMMLKLLHPKCSLSLDSTDDILEILEMSKKYDMEGVTERARDYARRVLPRVGADDPIRAYVAASRLGLDDEVTRAAGSSLRLSISDILDQTKVTELKYITGTQLQNLYNYHHKCGRAASALTSSNTWIPPYNTTPVIWFNNHAGCEQVGSILAAPGNYGAKVWWVEYMRDSSAALESRPHSSTVMKPELVNTALQKATACGTCRENVFRQLPAFLETYAAEVERVVSEVRNVTSNTMMRY